VRRHHLVHLRRDAPYDLERVVDLIRQRARRAFLSARHGAHGCRALRASRGELRKCAVGRIDLRAARRRHPSADAAAAHGSAQDSASPGLFLRACLP
jgi:hypothetical protein